MITPNADAAGDIEVLRQFFSRGGSAWMLTDIDRKDLDTLYAYATQLFDANQWQAAHNVYSILVRVDHWCFDYWLALGFTCQRLGSHDEAVFCFARAGTIRLDDPRPPYFTGISCLALGSGEAAGKAFNAALRACGCDPRHDEIRASAADQLARCP